MSMSINGSQLFGGSNGVKRMQGPPPGPPPGGAQGAGKSPIDAVTDVLGMSKDEITTALQSGKSLNDLADSKGVSHDDLISALKAGMPDGAAKSSDADQMLEAIAAQPGLQGPPGMGGAGGSSGSSGTSGFGSASRVSGLDGGMSGVLSGALTSTQKQTLDELSSLLGSDSQSLMDSLKNGTSLADLVKDKGLSSSTLANVIQDGLMVDTKS